MKARVISIYAIGGLLFITSFSQYFAWSGGNYLLLLLSILLALLLALLLLVQLAVMLGLRNKKGMTSFFIGLAAIVLSFYNVKYQPVDIIRERFLSPVVYRASSYGVAGCHSILLLRLNKTFEINSYCFGITSCKGSYIVERDSFHSERALHLHFTTEKYKYVEDYVMTDKGLEPLDTSLHYPCFGLIEDKLPL